MYTPLHLVPPTVHGLITSIENKYKINASNIRFLYRKNKDGIVAKIDDDMLRLYCNEDVFLMQVRNNNNFLASFSLLDLSYKVWISVCCWFFPLISNLSAEMIWTVLICERRSRRQVRQFPSFHHSYKLLKLFANYLKAKISILQNFFQLFFQAYI